MTLFLLMFLSICGISNAPLLQSSTTEPTSSCTTQNHLSTATQPQNDSTQWIDVTALEIEGMGWDKAIRPFRRLPDKYKDTVTESVWYLSSHSAGIAVHFTVTGTTFIDAKWQLNENLYLAHMTPQGVNGLDLYVKIDGQWKWAGIGKPSQTGNHQHCVLREGFLPHKTYECMVYLPLYTGVASMQLGFSPLAEVKPYKSNKKPIVCYGTSILHGCSASRTGMTFVAMLGRHFDIPTVNLGFSGNGKMENYFADILGEIDASLYLIDCLPNMGALSEEEIYQRVCHLVRRLRALHPQTPIVLVEDRTMEDPVFTDTPPVNPRRRAQKRAYDILKKSIAHLYYIKGNEIFGSQEDATVDGSHPSDLGMLLYYHALKRTVGKALHAK